MPSKFKAAGRRAGPPKGKGGKGGKSKGKRSFGGARKFDSARVADIEDVESDVSEEEDLLSDDVSEDDGSDSENEQEQPSSRPYFALMQSLSKEKESAPRAKRRKLAHQLEDGKSSSGLNQGATEVDEGGGVDGDEDEDRDVDHVEEAEEGPDDDVMVNDDDDDIPDSSDPFETHFVNPDNELLQRRLKAIQTDEYLQSNSLQNGWRLIKNLPGKDSAQSPLLQPSISGPSSLKLKHRLIETATRKRPTFDKLEQVLYPLTFSYNDILFCGRTTQNAENLRRMACLHSVNHVFKTRDKVIKNNAKLAKEGENSDFEPRDQGFTRPKVLMLLPTRNSAVKMVNSICALCEPEQQENRKRFDDSYLDKEAKFSADRPDDFRELFDGNDDDMFRIGVKFTRKTIKYFAQFYNSDILIASPLGMRMAIGSEEDKGKKQKGVDFDFLSSIEIVVVDQADALLMQNWEHVEFVLDHLNRQPREAHDCDFSRVREWYLDGRAANFRQTLVFSAFNAPELAELHRRHGRNWEGRVRVQPEAYPGAIEDLGVKVKQTFSRFEAPSIAAEPDARFEYFKSAVVPSLLKKHRSGGGGGGGTLIFVPSYLDFVRVRNYLATSAATSSLTFGAVSEYAEVGAASRARSHFLSGRHQVLLYTERAHHFRRYGLRGARRVLMYGLPDNPLFYREIAGGYLGRSEQDLRLEPGQGSVRVLFSRYDLLRLERVVGSKRVGRMLREKGDTFDFV
ncbi:rRNA-binding ribosome biosynthesis protein utp25 [Parahypoxylon ruwenzoriense]